MNVSAWGFIPARGGSKSIPQKNLVPIGGRPLLDYVGLTAKACGTQLQRLIGSTDSPEIARRFRDLGIEVDTRPPELAADTTPVANVANDFLARQAAGGIALPDFFVLFQPTSPFVLLQHVQALLTAMAREPSCRSGHTIVPCPHNHHELNQRWYSDGWTAFAHQTERSAAYNKQLKSKRWVFGNLVAARSEALIRGGDFFAVPSVGVPIERPYDLDVDGPSDIVLAEALLSSGAVDLPHLAES